MAALEQAIIDFFEHMGLLNLTVGNIVMIIVGLTLVYLAIRYGMEPLLLLPIGISAVLVNLPLSHLVNWPVAPQLPPGMEENIFATMAYLNQQYGPPGLFDLIYYLLIKTEIVPLLIFFGLGAMTDFGPMIADPKTALLGAAAQIGVFIAMLTAIALGFSLNEAASIGIIGGADGPTTIYLTTKLAPHILGATAVAAYSYMSLVPLIQPPVIKALTSKEERRIRMEQLRPVSKREKIIFPIISMIVIALLVPTAAPLVGMLMIGNLFRESGVVERLSKAAQEELMNIVTIFLGLGVGSTMRADSFLTAQTLMILGLGIVAFTSATAGGVLLGKLMMKLSGGKINPMIGAAGVSAVPMSARVVQRMASEEDPGNFLLMHAMGPNVAGVIGTAVAAGVLLSVLG
ncbi:sodium ion-translocating decarboxylase subunit beta [Thermococcus thioreducens]|uniref:Glutaconyl-CoA decarboxylase subunit beta n=1 Tax=Thermococcus thioreducens TaxID=277988 RepID=A0A0Q2M1K1_9EURY|nr:sodium ion-translocating decarboxylase subunit beta [Thermococcus thioreducens]ASJ11781.1 glutaconyl-CoA decarboxylase subunit beta [Thermococcus thioreducens]KQH81929.1 glutaconyl-CoA decarboxylase subunit beta [Thermococcus thioreducens]SEW13947.1 oxaloacetate decarboxylase, beta subunit [Thermococcus thioreducens]